jgi:hypothetical protein
MPDVTGAGGCELLPTGKGHFGNLACRVVQPVGLLVRDVHVAVALNVMTPWTFTAEPKVSPFFSCPPRAQTAAYLMKNEPPPVHSLLPQLRVAPRLGPFTAHALLDDVG